MTKEEIEIYLKEEVDKYVQEMVEYNKQKLRMLQYKNEFEAILDEDDNG